MQSEGTTPPPLPPPLPSTGAPPPLLQPPSTPSTPAKRLHPLTLFFNFVTVLRGYILPLAIIFVAGRGANNFLLWILLAITVMQSLVRYFTLTYRMENGELVTRSGLLEKKERHIPLSRIQDVRIEQGVLKRAFNVVDVHVETAGGTGAEASFSVLSREEAERIREAVFAVTRETAAVTEQGTTASLLPKEDVVRELSTRELVLAGIASNKMASTMAFVAVIWSLMDDFVGQEKYQQWMRGIFDFVEAFRQDNGGSWLIWVAAFIGLIAVSTVLSVIGSIILFHGFKLTLRGEDLHRAYGLLTRRASSLPRKRIQLLKIEETIMRRLFKLATVYADTAGSPLQQQQNQDGRNVLLPVIPQREVDGLLPVFFPHLDPAPADWKRVSRVAIRRGTLPAALLCVLLTIVLILVQRSWVGIWPMALVPLIYVANVMNYRHLGYALGEEYFRTRRGWLRRSTHIVPLRNIQCVAVNQSPFDRRHRVATVSIDTAGQSYTGGTPAIDNVPEEEAKELARVLSARASRLRYQWK